MAKKQTSEKTTNDDFANKHKKYQLYRAVQDAVKDVRYESTTLEDWLVELLFVAGDLHSDPFFGGYIGGIEKKTVGCIDDIANRLHTLSERCEALSKRLGHMKQILDPAKED